MLVRSLRAIIATISVALFVIVGALPAVAATEPGIASGSVEWKGQREGKKTAIRTSEFRVVDGTPGEKSAVGDSGWFTFSEEGLGSFVLDVQCVRVEGDWAEFTGVITEATGPYKDGGHFLVSVYDSGKRGGRGDEIGMGDSKKTWDEACKNGYNKYQFDRQGKIRKGNVDVLDPR
jgi:hypothetical protein